MKTVKLTDHQRALVKNLVKGMSLTDAALKAGYSQDYPGQAGFQALEQIRKKMPQLLENHGLSDDSLIEKYLKPALEANETKFFQFKGEVTDEREVISWSPRLTALDMTFKLRGAYAEDQQKGNGATVVNVMIHAPRPARDANGG